MSKLSIFLKLIAPVFLLVGALHLILGLGADVMLGAKVPAEAILDPTLDSQNRFYGVAFTVYGVLFFLCATDLAKYSTVLRCVLWVFFAAGLTRLVSIAMYGVPPLLVVALGVSELVTPPFVIWWLTKVEHGANRSLRTGPGDEFRR